LSARLEAERIRLEVRDNGIGIDDKLLPRVFDLFTQGGRGPDREGGGLGIGLALVKTLVALHGGEVRATSGGVGTGSTFTVWLPARTAAPARPSPVAEAVHSPLRQERILLVDDNEDGRCLHGAALANAWPGRERGTQRSASP
jgi:hypothetical protein